MYVLIIPIKNDILCVIHRVITIEKVWYYLYSHKLDKKFMLITIKCEITQIHNTCSNQNIIDMITILILLQFIALN